ncbi:MAG: hypothetical protein GTO09_08510 [Candidatus Latescibacteria bacterium]|nr:hypothetical protein [Candidatus Latescibacterota bacterium]
MKKNFSNTERRLEERECESFLVRYYGSTDPKDESTTFERFTATLNISDSGLCFMSPKPLKKSHRLRFISKELWDGEREGVVRWCSLVQPGIYKVGVELL